MDLAETVEPARLIDLSAQRLGLNIEYDAKPAGPVVMRLGSRPKVAESQAVPLPPKGEAGPSEGNRRGLASPPNTQVIEYRAQTGKPITGMLILEDARTITTPHATGGFSPRSSAAMVDHVAGYMGSAGLADLGRVAMHCRVALMSAYDLRSSLAIWSSASTPLA